MPLPEHGTPVVLDKVDLSMVGKKLRLVGRMSWYEPVSGLLALVDGDRGILVDVSLCVTPSSTWVQEHLCQLVVLGYLEIRETVPSIPFTPERKQVIDPRIILHAVLVTPDDTLNITEYKAFLEKEL